MHCVLVYLLYTLCGIYVIVLKLVKDNPTLNFKGIVIFKGIAIFDDLEFTNEEIYLYLMQLCNVMEENNLCEE